MSKVQNDRWYKVKVHLKMNSIVNGKGVSNGVIESWIDGVKKLSLSNVMIRTSVNSDMKWNQIMLAPWFHNGTPKAQKFWIDDLVITNTSGPAAPVGVRVHK